MSDYPYPEAQEEQKQAEPGKWEDLERAITRLDKAHDTLFAKLGPVVAHTNTDDRDSVPQPQAESDFEDAIKKIRNAAGRVERLSDLIVL